MLLGEVYYNACNNHGLESFIYRRYYQDDVHRIDSVFFPRLERTVSFLCVNNRSAWSCEICTYRNKEPKMQNVSDISMNINIKKARGLPVTDLNRVCEMCGSLNEIKTTINEINSNNNSSAGLFTKIAACSVMTTASIKQSSNEYIESVYTPMVVNVRGKRCYMNAVKGNTTRPKFVCYNDEAMYVEPFIINTFQHPEHYENDSLSVIGEAEREFHNESKEAPSEYFCNRFNELVQGNLMNMKLF